jgi:metallo-beta-lactamase family protein
VYIDDADIVLMESTYGDRNHRSWDETYNEMADIFEQATKSKGNILIPAFAVGRTQALLHLFAQNRQAWGLDRWQLFLDSPLAIEATEVYFKHTDLLRDEAKPFWRPGKHNDVTDRLTLTRTTEESMRLNTVTCGAVIIAGSGMCTGGRIRHHLRFNISRKDCHIIVVGYQEIGTTGRALVDGAKSIKLWGERYPVEATVHTVGGLSAHADQQELVNWYRAINNTPPVWLVHGEPMAQSALISEIKKIGTDARIMQRGQTMKLPSRR